MNDPYMTYIVKGSHLDSGELLSEERCLKVFEESSGQASIQKKDHSSWGVSTDPNFTPDQTPGQVRIENQEELPDPRVRT